MGKRFYCKGKKLKKDFPDSKPFLFIETSKGWSGISDDDINLGEKYFILSKGMKHITNIENLDSVILTPIENLFRKLI